jgi:hypothetical protein
MKKPTFWDKLWKFLGSFFSDIGYILDQIKFLFTIPLVGVASSVFTFVILLIGKTFLMLILPPALQIGIVESLISTVIFMVIMVVLFRDKLEHKHDFDPKKELMGLAASSLIWMAPMYFIGVFLSEWLGSYLATMNFADTLIEPTESVWTFVALIFYSPHMWLSTITGDFGLTMIGAYILNLVIFFIISRRDIKVAYGID